ncbi:MAG: aminotransferase class V-fold PLP-dependent enzyme [Bacteroidia bacterium]
MIDRRIFLKQMLGSAFLFSSYLASAKPNLSPKQPEIPFQGEPDWEAVRKLFPLTYNRVYFNNGTMGPSPLVVLAQQKQALEEIEVLGDYNLKHQVREHLASLLHAEKEEIALTHNTTEAINIVCWGLKLKAKDEVIVTNHEHVGNGLPWLNRARVDKIQVKYFELGKTAEETFHNLKKTVTSRTKVLAIPHITCTNGQVLPIKEICEWAKARNIYTSIDGAHAPGMMPVDVKQLGCDFYAGCGHKWLLGPKGTGFLYVSKEHLEKNTLQPYFVGAYSDCGWEINVPKPILKGYNPTAQRYDYGTQNPALYQGLETAIEFLQKLGLDKIQARNHTLANYLQEGLLNLQLPHLEMLTPQEAQSRAAMITFKIKGTEALAFAKIASENCFRIRIVPEHGLNAIRVSTSIYNDFYEIDNFLMMVKENFTK